MQNEVQCRLLKSYSEAFLVRVGALKFSLVPVFSPLPVSVSPPNPHASSLSIAEVSYFKAIMGNNPLYVAITP